MAGFVFACRRISTTISRRCYCRAANKTIWIVCPSVHSQEMLYESLLNWQSGALFLPEAEFAAVENILPDPEIAAERLALLTKIERQPGPHLIVATRAGLDQPAPKRGAPCFGHIAFATRKPDSDGGHHQLVRRSAL